MLSSGSWVFNKKDRGRNDVYSCFRLNFAVPVNNVVNRVSFKFSRIRGSKLYKKQHQAMETETPIMLLFISNSTDPQSFQHDITQMIDTALDNIDSKGMMPEEFKNKELPPFTLKLNAPWLSLQTKQMHKAYNHFQEQGKKVFHCEVAKEDVPFFHYLANYAHHLLLEKKYFGKSSKFTATLGNNAPLSN